MKILVTGGAGFIGSHVVDVLLARGERVICLDNFNDYYSPAIKRANIVHNLTNSKFKLSETDICNLDEVKKVFEGERLDAVIHLAARAGVRPSIADPRVYQETNIGGTLNLLLLSREFGIKNFIFASSSSVYGDRSDGPFKESDNVDNPISPYAATKRAGELLCYTYHHLYNIPITCLRFFTVYGERGRPDMAPLKFTIKIERGEPIEVYGDGKSLRDFTYVGDIVDGILSALDKNLSYEIINLGNSSPIVLMDFIGEIEGALGKKAKIIFKSAQKGDVGLTYADTSKANKLLGFAPKVKIKEGLTRLASWYKTHKNLYS